MNEENNALTPETASAGAAPSSGPPLIKTVEDYTGPMFSREVLEEFTKHRKEEWLAVVRRASMWKHFSDLIPSLPKVEELTPFDVPAIYAIRSIEPTDTWEEFAKKCNLKLERRMDDNNPWLPSYTSKSPDKPNSWVRSILGTPLETNEGAQIGLIQILKDACPFGGGTGTVAQAAIGSPASDDTQTLGEILDKFLDLRRFWARPLGGEHLDSEFRLGKTLSLVAGLGFPALRVAAGVMKDDHLGWDHWESCSDKELYESVMSARRIHGYPIGLLRADGAKVTKFLNRYQITTDGADWFTPLIILHILKYARFVYTNPQSGGPSIQIIRKGVRNVFPLENFQLYQAFSASANASLKSDVLKALGVPHKIPTGRGAFTDVAVKVAEILGYLRPSDLCALRTLDERPDLAVPKAVRLVPTPDLDDDYEFITPGCGVTNVARIDYESGTVTHERILSGADVGAIRWPEGELTEAELSTWKACLPEKVEPMKPSQVVFKYIRNVNDLGYPRAMRAVYDAFILLDLFRHKLAGSAMGNALIIEYPICMVLPMGHTKEDTTNQGKTNLGRITMHTICPGVPVIIPSRSSSAPAQRAAASPLDDYGTALYDEFQLPSSHEHFLAQAGLQSLATGGTVTPGRAMENSKGVKLRHSMVICTKICAFPPDIRNRAACFFMDTLTDETRCSDEELRIIGTGLASVMVRMNALAWADRINFVEKVKTLVPHASAGYRFPAFLTMVIALCESEGGTKQEVLDYLKACSDRCEDQQMQATASGLADDIGAVGEFSARYFLELCSTHTKDLIKNAQGKHWTAANMLKDLVEDQDSRKLTNVLREYHIKESTALAKFAREVREGKMIVDGWTVEAYNDPRPCRQKEGRKYYRLVNGDFSGDTSAPSASDLNAQFNKNLNKDAVASIKDAMANPDLYKSDKPSKAK